jgi:hypothetical protein
MQFRPASHRFASLTTQPLTEPVTQFDTVTLGAEESVPTTSCVAEERAGDVQSTLSGALQADVARFLQAADATNALPVLAASLRHSRAVALHLAYGSQQIRIVTLPRMHAYASDLDLHALTESQFREFRLCRVDEGSQSNLDVSSYRRGMLGDLVWRMALHGPHHRLQPEIAGPLAYRSVGRARYEGSTFPGVDGVVRLLSGAPATLGDLARSSGNAELTRRVLNALYLRSALIVTRACAPRPRNHGALWL